MTQLIRTKTENCFLTLLRPKGGGGRFDPQQIKTVVT